MKLGMQMMRSALSGAYVRTEHFEKYPSHVYRYIWRFCRVLRTRGECEDSAGHARYARLSACHDTKHIERNNVRWSAVTRLFVFAYSVTDDGQKNKFKTVFQKVKYRHYSEPRS